MKKNQTYGLYCILIFTLILSLIMISCDKEKIISDTVNRTYILENKENNTSFFVKIDTINGANAKGRIYLIMDELMMKAQPFSMVLYRKKCVLLVSDKGEFVMKFKTISDDKIKGVCNRKKSSKKFDFVLYPYHYSDYQLFGNRYKESLFDVERIADVNYAKVKGFWSSIPDDTIDIGNIVKMGLFKSLKKKDLDLLMDIYIPKDDTLETRPLMMFIHGGAFFIGDKATEAYRKWCTHFASLGYVCVSINYRMGFRINSKAIERTAYQATQDAHAAMRYLISKKDIYRIDIDNLFVGGASAGSITAINLTYMRNKDRPESSYSSILLEDLGDLETSGNKLYNKFKIKAVANMWGSVNDLNILNNSSSSIISFHGDSDVIIPYGFGYPFRAIGEFKKVFFDEMYGSKYIHEKAQELGIRSVLHTFTGKGHALHLDENRKLNQNFYLIQNEIVDFFYDELVPHPVVISQDDDDIQLFIIDTTEVLFSNWNVIGGINLQSSVGKVRASWFDDAEYRELKVSGYYKNGAAFEDSFIFEDLNNENNSYE